MLVEQQDDFIDEISERAWTRWTEKFESTKEH